MWTPWMGRTLVAVFAIPEAMATGRSRTLSNYGLDVVVVLLVT